MEVVDDMKLGKILKQAGFRSCVGIVQDAVAIRWHAGLGNLVRGVTKNFFAAAGYNLGLAFMAAAGLLLLNVAPFVALIVGHGWIRILAAVAGAIAMGFHIGVDMGMRVSPLYALTQPVGAGVFCFLFLVFARRAVWQGGGVLAGPVVSVC